MTGDRGQDIFKRWAPTGAYWSQYAKAVLFANMTVESGGQDALQPPVITGEMGSFLDTQTAVIIDTTGEQSVLKGVAMARQYGYRPVPLFNGVPQTQTDGIKSIVDNSGIIKNLSLGAQELGRAIISSNAPPVFLLDSNRNMAAMNSENMHDNRWSVVPGDMPRVGDMRNQRMNKLVVWTDDEVANDLKPIISEYQAAGIEVLVYRQNSLSRYSEPQGSGPAPGGQVRISMPTDRGSAMDEISDEMKKNVRNFNLARIGLLIFSIFSFTQLFAMFGAADEPAIWTSPSLMWLVYLAIDGFAANIIALSLPIAYLAFYLLSKQRRTFIVVALAFFAADMAALYIFAIFYGLSEFNIVELGIPIIFLSFLIIGAVAWAGLKGVSENMFNQIRKAALEERRGDRWHGEGWNSRKCSKKLTITECLKKYAYNFKLARLCLLIFTIFAFVQLFFLFSSLDEPLIWTSPGLMWIIYTTGVRESSANAIAILMPVIYLSFYILSRERRVFIPVAMVFFAIDTLVLYGFAISYGLYNFDIVELGPPVFIMYFLIIGTVGWYQLRGESYERVKEAKRIATEEARENREEGGGFFHGGRGYRGGGGYGG